MDARVETKLDAEALEQREIPRALRPEAEVLPDDDDARIERTGDELAGEAFGRPCRELGVESAHVDPLNSDLSHELRARFERRQKRRNALADNGGGVRIEGEHASGQSSGTSLLNGLAEDCLVTSVDPVEVSDDQSARKRAQVRRGRGAIDVDQPGGDHCAR
jgi:hypothetical protein